MSTSVASVVSHFPSAENGFTTTLASTISSGAATVPLNSVAGYANGEIAVFVVDPTDAAKKQTFTGTIDTAGVQVTNVVWTAGTNQTHSGGATVVDYATATHISMMTKGILVEHNQAGNHTGITASTISVTGASTFTGALTVKSYDGWISSPDTWTYASASSFTISGVDRTAQFPKGTKIKLTQTTAKYFYVTSTSFSTNTTVNITGGTDYTLANAAITSPSYSYMQSPQAFPDGFAYTSTLSGRFTDGDWTKSFRFWMNGARWRVEFSLTSVDATPMAGGSANAIFTLPVTSTSPLISSDLTVIGKALIGDSGTAIYPGYVSHTSTTTASIFAMDDAAGGVRELAVTSTTPMTWTTSDTISGWLEGRIA